MKKIKFFFLFNAKKYRKYSYFAKVFFARPLSKASSSSTYGFMGCDSAVSSSEFLKK
jgi:hypothetical protein